MPVTEPRPASVLCLVGRLAALLACCALASPARAADWLQFGGDSRHANVAAPDPDVNAQTVGKLSRLFLTALPDSADGSPAYVSGVSTTRGPRDLLFMTLRQGGALVALDARTGTVVWMKTPGPGTAITMSCPVVDPARRYVYSYVLDGFVHRYRVADGVEVAGDGWPELVTRKPMLEKVSSSLAIATARSGRSYLYVTTSSFGDDGDYQGHLTTVDLENGSQRVFNALCNDQATHLDASGAAPGGCPMVGAGIWARSGVVYHPALDRVFLTTSNGPWDPTQNAWSDSVIALAPDGTGSGSGPLDSYTPEEQAVLGAGDEDLGSAAPAVLPTLVGSGKLRHLALQASKDGKLRLLDLDNLSGRGGPGHIGGALQVLDFPGETLTEPTAATDPRDSSTWVFVANDLRLSAFRLEGGADAPQLVPKWSTDHGGTTPLFSGGLLFVAASNRLEARDAFTGTLLFQDGSDGKLGRIHMQSPILVNGILYLTDIDTQVHAWSVDGRPPAASTLLVPSVAHSPGANGSFFRTDLTIANTAGAEAVLTFKFLGHDVDGTSGPTVSFLIGAGATETYPDVLKSVFRIEGTFGALRISSTRPGLSVLAHTYTDAKEGGTYGQMVAGLAPEELSTKASPRSLLAVRDDDSFRTNLILASGSSAPLSIDVTALDAAGNPLGSRTVTLPPLGMTQISRVLQSLGVATSTSARIVASTKDEGSFAVYGSLIENVTNGPRILPPR